MSSATAPPRQSRRRAGILFGGPGPFHAPAAKVRSRGPSPQKPTQNSESVSLRSSEAMVRPGQIFVSRRKRCSVRHPFLVRQRPVLHPGFIHRLSVGFAPVAVSGARMPRERLGGLPEGPRGSAKRRPAAEPSLLLEEAAGGYPEDHLPTPNVFRGRLCGPRTWESAGSEF